MILVFGTVCIDRIRRVAELPKPGGYAEIEEELRLLGGEAANTANALRVWGADVTLTGNSLGLGPDGAVLRGLLREHDLDDRWLQPRTGGLELEQPHPGQQYGPDREADTERTPVCDIYVTPDGERTMFGMGFAGSTPPIPVGQLPYRSGAWFTAEPNMTGPSREAARAAAEAGMKLYLMDYIRADDPIEPGSVWQSSTDWAGYRNNTQRNVQWVKEFVARRRCLTILSDGPNGFVAGSPDLPVRAYPPYPAPSVVDTTGAGDAFRAGMLFGLDQAWPISDCLRFASAAGCLKCRALGATTQVPTVAEITAHIAENGDVSRQYA